MKTNVTFKNLDSSDALKEYAANKLARLDKQFDTPAEANVVLSTEKNRHIAEVRILADGLTFLATEEQENNMYAALDLVVDKLKTQIQRTKGKVQEKRG